jgi:hypothetical protein
MKFLKLLLVLVASLILVWPAALFGQTQNLKGQVIDKAVRYELIGARVQIAPVNEASPQPLGVITDAEGRFRFPDLAVGKYHMMVTYVGYKDVVLSNITLDAGKETDLVVEMEEAVLQQREVVVTARREKEKPLNDLSLVSTRTFSVEETRRFAAAVNDPARMATSFAGVVAAEDGNNHIVIRGNAPNGLLWRMEGVDIPNPNHFSSAGTSGGGISILSAQLLGNSDFSTGAFAAEYGNALSGVFDLKLRKGNMDKREFTFQAGFLGLDAAVEGPLKGGNGSYLINYRYSTLSLLAKLGVPLGDAVTNFQDLSFNVWKSAGKFGSFSLFGFGGLSKQSLEGNPDTGSWIENPQNRYPFVFQTNTGAVGITHNKVIGSSTHIKTALVFSGVENIQQGQEYVLPDSRLRLNFDAGNSQTKATLSTVVSHKFNARHYLRSGVYVNQLYFELRQSEFDEEQEEMNEYLGQRGNTQTVQAFTQWQYRPTERVTFNLGVHSLSMLLNQKTSVEPRAALQYSPSARQRVTLGYGLHSQVMPLGMYYLKNEQGALINQELDLSKAHHLVAAYDFYPGNQLHFKAEGYYQHLFNVPVERGVSSSFSVLNVFGGLPFHALENSGKGRNYGLELTAEQFLTHGFYGIASLSLFRSEYQGSDRVWRNGRYDSRYASSLTAGKEWNWDKGGKKRTFGLNMKLIGVGGQRENPIDLEASKAAGREIIIDHLAFSEQLPAYFRVDLGLRLKRNYKNMTTTLSLDIQNVTNRQNIGGKFYNPDTQEIVIWNQAPLLPVLAYRLDF